MTNRLEFIGFSKLLINDACVCSYNTYSVQYRMMHA